MEVAARAGRQRDLRVGRVVWIVTAAFAITALAVSKTVPSIAPWLVDCAGIGMDAPQRIATESTVLAIISIFVTINSDTS